MTDALERVVATILAAEIGEDRSATEVAAGFARTADKLARHLNPLIGELGMCTVFERSITLGKRRFRWLATPSLTPAERPWTALGPSLEEQPASVAMEAAQALLEELVALLTRLIGSGLVSRLLWELWPHALPKESP